MPWTRRAQWAHWAHWVHCVLSDTGITKDTGKTPTGHRRVNGHVVRHRAKTPVTSVISIDRDSYSWKTSFALQEAFRTKNLGLHNTIPPFKARVGWGWLKTEIFHFGGVTPPPHLEIFQLKISGL